IVRGKGPGDRERIGFHGAAFGRHRHGDGVGPHAQIDVAGRRAGVHGHAVHLHRGGVVVHGGGDRDGGGGVGYGNRIARGVPGKRGGERARGDGEGGKVGVRIEVVAQIRDRPAGEGILLGRHGGGEAGGAVAGEAARALREQPHRNLEAVSVHG